MKVALLGYGNVGGGAYDMTCAIMAAAMPAAQICCGYTAKKTV